VERRGERILDLVAVMDRLRSPGGCPWDANQTHASLVQYLLEETYETIEAIETGDPVALREELGDLLLQVVFHARIAEEDPRAPWDVDAVADGIVTKLVSRHPHVFGDATADTPEQVESAWQAIKAAEKGRTSVTDGVPMGLPALTLAAKLHTRARNGGVVDDGDPAPAALRDVVRDLPDQSALGRALLDVVALAQDRGWDAEAALRQACRDYVDRLRAVEGCSRDLD
jgi:XTP/dITP diphosphohydrolase